MLGIFFLAILTSCSSIPEDFADNKAENNIESSNSTSSNSHSVDLANEKKRIISCGAMPPIKDRSKLKLSLINTGIITSEMSPEEADEKVAEFIRKKQQGFNNCHKFKPEGTKPL
ncbi:hypothetical protein SHVI106290_15095 [Shewanella violacea]